MARIKIPMDKRVCEKCGLNTTRMRPNKYSGFHPEWHNVDGQCWCQRCWKEKYSHWYNRNRRNDKPWDKKKFRFKDKRFKSEEEFRVFQCQICGNKIGDEYINCFGKKAITKKIDNHHLQYHEDNPLLDTIELCMSCHMKISKREIQIINI